MKITILKSFAILLILVYIFPSIKICLLLPDVSENINAEITNINVINDGITITHEYTYEFVAKNGKKYSGKFNSSFKDAQTLKYGPFKTSDKIQIRYFPLLPNINKVNHFTFIEKSDISSVTMGFILIFSIIFIRKNPFYHKKTLNKI